MRIDFNIERLVPHFILQDKNGYALAKAIEAGLKYFLERVSDGLAILDDISVMPEWRLNELAWELDIAWFDYSADIETKRAIISGAEDYFKRIGTPAAVQRVIEDVYGYGRVVEWFEYGGEPYHFTVYVNNPLDTESKHARFIKLLEQAKNVRSVLENLYYVDVSEMECFTGSTFTQDAARISISYRKKPDPKTSLSVSSGARFTQDAGRMSLGYRIRPDPSTKASVKSGASFTQGAARINLHRVIKTGSSQAREDSTRTGARLTQNALRQSLHYYNNPSQQQGADTMMAGIKASANIARMAVTIQ